MVIKPGVDQPVQPKTAELDPKPAWFPKKTNNVVKPSKNCHPSQF